MSFDFPPLPGAKWQNGFVYYIMSGELGRMKIGFTRKSPVARLKALQTGSPVKLVIVAYHPGDEATEARLHREFEADRLHGEWFEISDDLIVHMAGVYNLTEALYRNARLPVPSWVQAGQSGIRKVVEAFDE